MGIFCSFLLWISLKIFSPFTNFLLKFRQFPEPIGYKKPAFANDVKSITITREENSPFELSCRAQSFPPPSYRYHFNTQLFLIVKKRSTRYNFDWTGCLLELSFFFVALSKFVSLCTQFLAEPVGFKAPVFSTDSKSSLFERSQNTTLALLCPSQAFPVPVYRYNFKVRYF